jgi:hypothetical protein
VLLLRHSRAMWAELVLEQTTVSLVRSLVRAAQYFGGATREWLFDNPKSIVAARVGRAIRFQDELEGTGFDLWDSPAYNLGTDFGGAGATTWLISQAPVKGGEEITIRFAMWDTGDANFDSSTLVDNFQWIATHGTQVTVGTTPVPQPQ